MRTAALLPLSLSLLVSARVHHSRVPEDPYAFPKYRVSFLNGLPLLNDTAQRWLQDGLRGGENEFLDRPWDVDEGINGQKSSPFQQIDSGEQTETTLVRSPPALSCKDALTGSNTCCEAAASGFARGLVPVPAAADATIRRERKRIRVPHPAASRESHAAARGAAGRALSRNCLEPADAAREHLPLCT